MKKSGSLELVSRSGKEVEHKSTEKT